jgi:Protein kinase domain
MTEQDAQALPSLRDYEVAGVLATGSSGTFYSGRHRLTAHPVALQRIAPHLAETPGFVDRLGEAARTVAGLRNPHVVGVYDLVVEDGVFLVLELVPGASLRAVAAPGQALAPAAAIAAVDDVLNALETAHGAGMVHSDIRAERVLVTPNGIAKLGGLAVTQALMALPGHPGAGRPGYTSPERLAGRPPDEASDLYAAAALASELMTGSTPSPGRIGPAALPAVADVLRRALSVDASRRYGSATELRSALVGATAGSMGPAWRLASDLGSRATAAASAAAAAAGAAAQAIPTPISPMAAMAPAAPSFSTPPPPASTAGLGGQQPAPMARPPVSPPSSYLPPPTPRARAAITEVDSEDRRRPPWLIPLIAVIVLAVIGGGLAGAAAMGAFGGSGGGNASGPLVIGGDVKVQVSPSSGGCNTVFNFTATGSIVSGSGTMTYHWERSDGFHSADVPVTVSGSDGSFSLPGPPWRISGNQSKLQMTFHVTSPTERVVTQAVPYSCQ